jgi:succinate dehydrogenase/fumarate reductase flavoprotein subunit
MNQPAIDLYADRGVELSHQPLEIAVCNQHHNGGFVVDSWWQSSLPGLYVIGEQAGTHGVKRPGGAALNAGQVGALRAAQAIAHQKGEDWDEDSGVFLHSIRQLTERVEGIIERAASARLDIQAVRARVQHQMSLAAGPIRSLPKARIAAESMWQLWRDIREEGLRFERHGKWVAALDMEHTVLTAALFLTAIENILRRGGGSRGSYLALDEAGVSPHPLLGPQWNFLPENETHRKEVLEVVFVGQDPQIKPTPVRPIPVRESWFENVWAGFLRGEIFQDEQNGETVSNAAQCGRQP